MASLKTQLERHYEVCLMRHCEERSNLPHGAIMRLLRAKSPRNDGWAFLMARNDDEVFRDALM